MYCYVVYFTNMYFLTRNRIGAHIVRSTRYVCTAIPETQRLLKQRLDNIDHEVDPPTEVIPHRAAYFRSFPLLDKVALNKEPTHT